MVVEVEDRGVGMIGGLFAQNAKGSGANGGEKRAGVGLVVCRHLVEAVGGLMTARSAPGVGTTVRLELPAPRAAGARGTERAA